MQAEYRQRREQFMSKIGNGTAIIGSAPMAVMHNDVEYLYRQDSDFYYLTGFNEPHAAIVLAPHHEEHKCILFVQPKERERNLDGLSRRDRSSQGSIRRRRSIFN
jgi:Xaa-Pro aminopeptidase